MKRNRYTYQDVYNIFKKEGYVLLSKKYKNNKTKLRSVCSKGHNYNVSLNDFLRPFRCPKCANQHKYILDEILQECIKRKWKLLTKRYIDSIHHLKIICDKDHLITTVSAFRLFHGSNCPHCHKLIYKGTNHHNWNHKLSKQDRLLDRDINKVLKLKQAVIKRDKRTCQCCHKKKKILHNHHLEGYHWCKELRFEVSNGVTLCKDCHKNFHDIFGRKWNTTEQFYQFLRMKND